MSSSARKSISGGVNASETTPSVTEQKKRALEWAERMEKMKQQRVEEEKKESQDKDKEDAGELNEDYATPVVPRRSHRPRKSLAADELLLSTREPSDAETTSTVSNQKRASRRASLPLSAYLPQDEDREKERESTAKAKRSKRRASMESASNGSAEALLRDDVSVSSVDSKASKKSLSKRQSLRAVASLKSLAMAQIPEEEEEDKEEKKPKKKKTLSSAATAIESVPEVDEEREEEKEEQEREKMNVAESAVESVAEAVAPVAEGATEPLLPVEEQNLLNTLAEAEKILSADSAVETAVETVETIKQEDGVESSAVQMTSTTISPVLVRSSSPYVSSPARSATPLQDRVPSSVVMSTAFVSSPLRVSSSPSAAVAMRAEVLPLPAIAAPAPAPAVSPLPEIASAVTVAPLPLVSGPDASVEISLQALTKEEEQDVRATQDMLENALYVTGSASVLLGLCFDFNTWLVIIFLFVTVALVRRLGKMMLHYPSKEEEEEEEEQS